MERLYLLLLIVGNRDISFHIDWNDEKFSEFYLEPQITIEKNICLISFDEKQVEQS